MPDPRPRESVHLTSVHRPFDTRVFQKECRTLADAGYRVTLVAPHTRDEVVDGVRIRAVAPPASGRERLGRTVGDVYRAALAAPPDAVFHFHDPELIPAMLRLKRQGRRVVYDVHEDTPRQVFYQHWIPSALRRPVSWFVAGLEKAAGLAFDAVVAAEPVIAGRFPARKTVVVHNFPIADELVVRGAPAYAERPADVAYVGGITRVRGIREVLAAMERLPEARGARLHLGGVFFPSRLEEDVREMPGWARATYHGWLARADVAALLARVRVGIVVLHPTEKYLESYPTKLFEYMSAGLPVVASDFPVWRGIVEAAGCGLVVDPLDPAAIAGALGWLLDHPVEAEAMGRRGREAVRAHYSWEREAPKLLSLYARLLES